MDEWLIKLNFTSLYNALDPLNIHIHATMCAMWKCDDGLFLINSEKQNARQKRTTEKFMTDVGDEAEAFGDSWVA